MNGNGVHHHHENGGEMVVKEQEENFDNLQRAVQILSTAKTLDDKKEYADALKLYREGVDILLEELIVRQGTDQSRSYLRDKCNDFMNRIDQLKLIIQIEKATADKENNSQQHNGDTHVA